MDKATPAATATPLSCLDVDWFDPLEDAVRGQVRAFIEQLLEEELEEAKFKRACRWFNRWGIWSLLLSWLPVVGDPLTLVAGALRTAFVPFVLLVLVGKAAQYLIVLLVVT